MKSPKLLCLATLALAIPAAQAATLYSHTFDGTATSIDGVAPDTVVSSAVHGTGGNWSGDLFQDGGGGVDGSETALLAFSPQDGYVYTLSFTGFSTTTVDDWFGGGFLDSTNAVNVPTGSIAANFGIAWALNRPGSSNPSQVAHFNQSGGTGNIGDADESLSPSTVSIVLDTRDGTGSWDVQWFVNNSATAFATQNNISLTAEGNINAVGVGLPNGNSAEFTSMSLDVVPEPSSLSLLGLGFLTLLRRRRA